MNKSCLRLNAWPMKIMSKFRTMNRSMNECIQESNELMNKGLYNMSRCNTEDNGQIPTE